MRFQFFSVTTYMELMRVFLHCTHRPSTVSYVAHFMGQINMIHYIYLIFLQHFSVCAVFLFGISSYVDGLKNKDPSTKKSVLEKTLI